MRQGMGEEEMKFFKKELCEKLQKIGCVPTKEFYYTSEWPKVICVHESRFLEIPTSAPAFSIYDFLSDEGYAEENCFKVIKKNSEETPQLKMFNLARLAEFKSELVFAKNQEAYIEEAVNRVIKENSDG